jgi:4-amino-4-deoxy-L-arabinose transferase-like glycosyltransferase
MNAVLTGVSRFADSVTASRSRGAILLLAVCLLLFFLNLERVPFYDRGESREGLVVWEMFTSGNWVLPIINDEYIPSKPPLFHWTALLVAKIFGGVDEFTLRSPSAFFGALGVLLTYLTGVRLWGVKAGVVAALVLATSHGWWRAATLVQVDMTLAFCQVAALLVFFFLYREKSGDLAKALALALLLALATLAKGPLGIGLPCLVFLAFLLLERDFSFIKKLHPFAGALVFLAVAGSWYVLATWQSGEAFLHRQIVNENLLTAAGVKGHYQPAYYFIPIFFLNMAPWSFFFPALAVFLYQERRRLAEHGLRYLLVWFVTVFIFFSVALGKRGIYILPLYPAAALLFGAWWVRLEKHEAGCLGFVRLMGYLVAVFYLLVLAAGVTGFLAQGSLDSYLLHFAGKRRNQTQIINSVLYFFSKPESRTWLWTGFALSSIAALLLISALWKATWNTVLVSLACLTAATALLFQSIYYQAVAEQHTLKPFMERVREEADVNTPLLFYRSFDFGALFYARRHIPVYPENAESLTPPFFLLMWEEEWERLRRADDVEMLDKSEGTGPVGKHHMVLVKVTGTFLVPQDYTAIEPSRPFSTFTILSQR